MSENAMISYSEMRSKAQRLFSSGDFEDAAFSYSIAAELRPISDSALFQGISLKEAGQFDKAIEVLDAYTSLHPSRTQGWITRGMLLKQMNRFEDAAQSFRRSLAIEDNIPVRNALVAALWFAKLQPQAETEARRSLRRKHELAFESFLNSSFRDYTLREDHRRFDPARSDRNIIAFSLWGDKPEYVTGAIVNAQIAQHLYIGWTARFYCDDSVPCVAIAALQAYGAQIVMMNQAEHSRIRPMWRFLVSDDPTVDFFVCRDTDSRLNAKELLAVQAWLDSGKRFHVMRDHIFHHELMLAGMWGGMGGVLPNIQNWLRQAPQYYDNRFGDQAFLADMIWPLIHHDAQVHDSLFRYPTGDPFPKGYELPGLIHVGGSVKTMPHWSKYIQIQDSTAHSSQLG